MYSKRKNTYSNDPSTFTLRLSGTSKTGSTEVARSLLTLTLLAESGVSSSFPARVDGITSLELSVELSELVKWEVFIVQQVTERCCLSTNVEQYSSLLSFFLKLTPHASGYREAKLLVYRCRFDSIQFLNDDHCQIYCWIGVVLTAFMGKPKVISVTNSCALSDCDILKPSQSIPCIHW